MTSWFEYTGLVAVWLTLGWQIRDILRRRKLAKEQLILTIASISKEHELTPVQAQVALDAAEAAFLQRVAEMRRVNRAR
jgi:hypothetical protein